MVLLTQQLKKQNNYLKKISESINCQFRFFFDNSFQHIELIMSNLIEFVHYNKN